MPYPSTFTAFTYPNPTQRLNNPSQSSIIGNISSTLGQVEAVIGLDSSVIGTIIGDLRNANSGGGGHIQSANKGGTGQTSYTKGDLLIATSSSVLSKLAVGTSDGLSLTTDSSVASGIKWGVPSGSKVDNIASVVTFTWNNGFSNASLVSMTIPGSTLGTNNAIRLTSYINNYESHGGPGGSILLRATYGGGIMNSVMLRSLANTTGSIAGKIEYTIFANQATNSQRSFMLVNMNSQKDTWSDTSASVVSFSLYNSSVSSIQSSANQTFGLAALGGSNQQLTLTLGGTTVEKIV